MTELTIAQSQVVDYTYKKTGGKFPKCLIKFLILLPQPALTALRSSLSSKKQEIQGKINSEVIERLRMVKIVEQTQYIYNSAVQLLNAVRNYNVTLGIQAKIANPSIGECPKVQELIDMLSLGADTNATLDALKYEVNRAQNALDLSQNTLLTLNTESRIIDDYISLIDSL